MECIQTTTASYWFKRLLKTEWNSNSALKIHSYFWPDSSSSYLFADSDQEGRVADDTNDNIDVLDDEDDENLMVDGDDGSDHHDGDRKLHSPLEGVDVHHQLQMSALHPREGQMLPPIGEFKWLT